MKAREARKKMKAYTKQRHESKLANKAHEHAKHVGT